VVQRYPVGHDERGVEADAELPMRDASLRWSPVRADRKLRVPDLAMVPMWSMTVLAAHPMPLSATVIV